MSNTTNSDLEIERLRQEYARRAADAPSLKYSMDNPIHRYMIDRRHQSLHTLIKKYLPGLLSNQKILEIGCGSGGVLTEFQELGASSSHLFGLDLLQDRLQLGHQTLPDISYLCANGQNLPFADDSFDLLLQFTAFSSILDRNVKNEMASEMLRVLKPGGAVIWYDFIWNPTNAQTKGVGLHEIKTLFPDCAISASRITLAPPLTRLLITRFRTLANWLSSFQFLNSHLLVWIQKPN